MPDRLSDEILAKMAGEGDTHAFEELFNRHKKTILNFIYRMIGSRETAEEVTLEVFMNVYRNLDTFDPARKFTTWLYTIARNLTKNALRDKKYFRDVSLDRDLGEGREGMTLKDLIADETMRPDTILESEELQSEAQRVLGSMPPELKEVITLCSIQGLTYEEAGRIIGVSIAAVAVRLEKAKALFIKMLGIDLKRRNKGSDKDEDG